MPGVVGSPGWARTSDFLINSQALYRLSYRGMPARPTRYPQILPQFRTNACAGAAGQAGSPSDGHGHGDVNRRPVLGQHTRPLFPYGYE
jgi:hypothetical protein